MNFGVWPGIIALVYIGVSQLFKAFQAGKRLSQAQDEVIQSIVIRADHNFIPIEPHFITSAQAQLRRALKLMQGQFLLGASFILTCVWVLPLELSCPLPLKIVAGVGFFANIVANFVGMFLVTRLERPKVSTVSGDNQIHAGN